MFFAFSECFVEQLTAADQILFQVVSWTWHPLFLIFQNVKNSAGRGFFRRFQQTHFNPRHVAAVETGGKLDRFHSHLVPQVERGIRRTERVEGKGPAEEHLNTLTVKFKLPRVARTIIPRC